MGRTTFAILTSLALCVVFAMMVMLSGLMLPGLRVDVTQDQRYSLSEGARKTFANLAEPTTLTFYYSEQAAATAPLLRAHATQVRDLLASLKAVSGGLLTVQEINPVPLSAIEDEAIARGLKPAATKAGTSVYLGIVGNSRHGQRVAIPFLDPKRSTLLEYDLTRLIEAVDQDRRPKIALLTSLPMRVGAGGATAHDRGTSSSFKVYDELSRFADIEFATPDFQTLPKDADVLMIAHPWPLTPAQLFAVDQFILSKGRALILVDPATWIASAAAGGGQYAAPPSSELNQLFRAWGINVSAGVVADKDRALPVELVNPDGHTSVQAQPLFARLVGKDLASADPITADLTGGVHLAAPGAISVTKSSPFDLDPLIHSSKASAMVSASVALVARSPADLLGKENPDEARRVLAGRLQGRPTTAFPEGPPGGSHPLLSGNNMMRKSARGPVDMVLIADADMLEDGFYIDPQTRRPVADNASFIVSAIESLTGSDQLLSIHARTEQPHRMTRLDAMQADFDAQHGAEDVRLTRQIKAIDDRLQVLRAQKTAGPAVILGEKPGNIERLQTQSVAVRASLRNIRYSYESSIERLRTTLLALNTLTGPIVLALIGAGIAVRRRMRAGHEPSRSAS